MKLQNKIAFTIFGFGSLLLVAITSLFYLYSRSQYIDDIQLAFMDLARERSVNIDIHLRERVAIAASIASAPVITDVLEKSNSTITETDNEANKLYRERPAGDYSFYTNNEAADFLKELMKSRPGSIKDIYLTDRYGKVVAATVEVPRLSFSREYWWSSAYADGKGKIFFEDIGFDSAAGNYIVGLTLPVVKNKAIKGILKCHISVSGDLTETVEEANLGNRRQMQIVRSDGTVLFGNDKPGFSIKTFPVLLGAMKERSSGTLIIGKGEIKRIISYVPVSITFGAGDYGFISHDRSGGDMWYAILSQDLGDALSPLHDRLRGALLIGFLTMLLTGFFSMFIGRKLAMPVVKMEKIARQVGDGDFDVKMEVSSGDEVGLLANAFNRMIVNLREKTISRDLLTREVAERREAEKKLVTEERNYRELWQQFQAILHAITDNLVLLSPELDVIWSNKSTAVGYNLKCHNIWCSSPERCKDCPPLQSFQSGKPEESRITMDDGRVWAVRSFPIMGNDNRVTKVIETASDITEKVRLREEVMRAAQLASVGELAAGVAHEINNPINGIINLAQLLVDENPPDHKDREIHDWIISEGKRITLIVSELLSYARKNEEEKKSVKIEDIISNSLTLTRAQMEKEGICIKMNIPSHIPEVYVNVGQVKQVFLNIINNARYALNKKYSGWDKNKILEINAKKVNENKLPHLQIAFKDSGIGVPDNLKGKIGTPFFTTKPEGEGTGLGLSISHGIINDHGGKIIFDSREGEYTCVIVELPLREILEP